MIATTLLTLLLLAVPDAALPDMAEAITGYRTEQAREDLLSRLPLDDARELRAAATISGRAYNPTVGMQLTEEEMATLISVYFPERWHTWALNVSACESGWYSAAKNPRSTAAGLFQFLRGTWDWVAGETGTSDYDSGGVWEVHSQMVNASWLVQNGGPQHWVCKG